MDHIWIYEALLIGYALLFFPTVWCVYRGLRLYRRWAFDFVSGACLLSSKSLVVLLVMTILYGFSPTEEWKIAMAAALLIAATPTLLKFVLTDSSNGIVMDRRNEQATTTGHTGLLWGFWEERGNNAPWLFESRQSSSYPMRFPVNGHIAIDESAVDTLVQQATNRGWTVIAADVYACTEQEFKTRTTLLLESLRDSSPMSLPVDSTCNSGMRLVLITPDDPLRGVLERVATSTPLAFAHARALGDYLVLVHRNGSLHTLPESLAQHFRDFSQA